MNSAAKNIYNIPAGEPFARQLAGSLLRDYKDKEEQLSQVLILLPTRRACRVLRESFLDLRQGQALILPRMQPIGDLDEEELSLSIMAQSDPQESWSLPPALSPMRRQIILSKLIRANPLYAHFAHEQCLKLAQALGHMMDQVYTENLDLKNLAALVPDDFAKHWQITLKFLEIISVEWPKILKAQNRIDQADRRNQLIFKLARHWQDHPPAYPVIGAGSTGSIPATAELLKTIAGLPKGKVILPGLDQDMDEESWKALDETHPQYGFRHLLENMEAERNIVQQFEKILSNDTLENRHVLAREIFRPAETTKEWATLDENKVAQKTLSNALSNLTLLECEHGREEADVIALLMREALETPDKTACLITPDRALAARITASCERWGITVDDSAGNALNKTPRGTFMQLALEAALQNAAPITLLSVLKHNMCSNIEHIEALDIALRGTKPSNGFEGLRDHIEKQDKLETSIKSKALDALNRLETLFSPLLQVNSPTPFNDILKTHLNLCENLASDEILWSGEEGRHAAAFFAQLFDHAAEIDPCDLDEYTATLNHFMSQTRVRPAFGTHPRLQILGQLEARLIDADLVILGGLNEGIWPPDPATDPWMSRPMRKTFGLPGPERSIGLAAHDFMQGLCTPHVVLTRAKRESGVPTVPSRWLQRMNAVLQAANIKPDTLTRTELLHWAGTMDETQHVTPISRPMPCPPVNKRLRRLSATQIETWLRDPYAIYARHILGFKPLDQLEKPIDAAARGSLLHAVLERFISETKQKWPKDAAKTLQQIACEEIESSHGEAQDWSFWWPRFTKTAQWFAAHEKRWRNSADNIATEAHGEIKIATKAGDFKLVAIADRIDAFADGPAAVIDYKSGGQYSLKGMQNGEHPQLPLEALILREGGFEGVSARPALALQYWVLSGSAGGSITTLETDIETLTEQTETSLRQLIEDYDDPAMPYICLPRSDKAPRFNDYEHLARIREWGVTGDEQEDAA